MFFHLVQQTWEDASRSSLCEEQIMNNLWQMPSLPTLLWHRVGRCEGAHSSWIPGCCETMMGAPVSQSSEGTPPAVKCSLLVLAPGSRREKSTPKVAFSVYAFHALSLTKYFADREPFIMSTLELSHTQCHPGLLTMFIIRNLMWSETTEFNKLICTTEFGDKNSGTSEFLKSSILQNQAQRSPCE